MHPDHTPDVTDSSRSSNGTLLVLPVCRPGEPRRSLPLRPAGDPEQKSREARTREARWLSLRERRSRGRPGVAVDATRLPVRVLVIGLDPYRVPGPWDPAPVARAIKLGIARFAAHDVGVQTCLIGLDGSEDIAAVVTEALSDRTWECVVIGGGIRTADDQVELFEQVVNLVRRHAPGAAIAFNSAAEDKYEAAARWIR
jgi:hypothetical protein